MKLPKLIYTSLSKIGVASVLATVLLCGMLSSVFGNSEKQNKAIRGRAEALQAMLKLDPMQTDSLEVILRQTSEHGELHKERYDDDYYNLALENLREMDTMRAQVDALLTPQQRKQYRSMQEKQPVRYFSSKTEVLARRLLLDTSQARIVDAILSYSEQDIRKIHHESKRKAGGFGNNMGSVSERNSMLRRRSKLIKSHEAIEKVLTKAQKKEFKEYREEQMDMFRPPGPGTGPNGDF